MTDWGDGTHPEGYGYRGRAINNGNRAGCPTMRRGTRESALSKRGLYLAHMVLYCSPVGEPIMVDKPGKGESVSAARPMSLICRFDPFPRGQLRPNGIGGPPNAFGANL